MNPRMKFVFTMSLVLNIVLIAAGAGLAYKMCQDGPPSPGDLSPDAQQIISQTFKDGRSSVKPLFEDIKAARDKVEAVLTAETFDEKAYGTASSDLLDVRDKISRQRAAVMGKAMAKLPPQDRQKFARRALDGLEGRPRKDGRGHRDGDKQQDRETAKPAPLLKDGLPERVRQ